MIFLNRGEESAADEGRLDPNLVVFMIINEFKKDISFIIHHKLQPKWFKLFKILLLLSVITFYFFFFGLLKTCIWLSTFVFSALVIHFLYRFKTQSYSKSWMDFQVKKTETGSEYKRIGLLYYSLVFISFIISTGIIFLF